MVQIGGRPRGLIIKRDDEALFEFPEFWVLAKTREDAEEKVKMYHQGREDVRRFMEYDARPLTEKEKENQRRAVEAFRQLKPRSSNRRTIEDETV